MHKIISSIIGIICVGVLLLGCTSAPSQVTPTSQPAAGGPISGGRLVMTLDYDDISSLDPTVPDDNSSIWTVLNIYDQMFRVAADGKTFEPDIATDYTISTDGLVYTFNLRQGVKFSDGSPVTVDDVVFSLGRMLVSDNWGFLFPEGTVIAAAGTTAITITLPEPYAPLINNLAGFWSSIVPKAQVEAQGDAFWEKPIASGPFMVKEWVKGDHITLVKNPNYWEAGKPYLDEVELRPGSDDNTRVLKFRAGELDVLLQVPYNQIGPLDAMSNASAGVSTLFGMHRIYINTAKPPLDDLNVRLALNYATDRQAINEAVMYGYATNANTVLAQVQYWDASAPGFSYDLEKAKQYMAQSSAPSGFEVTVNYVTGNTLSEQELVLLQQQWAKIGVTLNIVPLDGALLTENFGSGLTELQAGYWSTSDVLDPAETLSIVLCSRTTPRQGFCDQQLEDDFNNALKEMDTAKRQVLYFDLQTRANEQAYWIPLFYFPNRFAYYDYVKNFSVLPTGNVRLWEVWIAK